MKCEETKHWLFTTAAEEVLPDAVLQHLHDCRRCRQLRQRLYLMDEEIRHLPASHTSARSRRRLEKKLSTPRPATVAGRSTSRRVMFGWAAACVLIVFGWLLGQYISVTKQEHLWAAPRPAHAADEPKGRSDELALVLRVVHHDVRLSEVTQLDEQLDRLLMLACDLKDEALLLLRHGKSEELPQLAELYQHVLRHGIGKRVLTLPPEVRVKRVPELVQKLRAVEAQLRAVAQGSVPLVADLLQPMQDATQETLDVLRSGREAHSASASLPVLRDPSPLLATLVLNGLRLTEDIDPLHRADLCADLARRVAPSIVLLTSAGEVGEASDLVESLATLLHRGVVNNLDRVESKHDLEARVAEMEKVRARLVEVVAILDKNLANAPPAAKAELQIALKAVQQPRKE